VLPALDSAPVVQATPPPQPIPVPPVEGPGGMGLGIDPLMLALGVLAAGALVYFLVRKKNNNANSPA
jgi:LPXTG-motif cell wall-anchored protein